jgi:hypothetical protein
MPLNVSEFKGKATLAEVRVPGAKAVAESLGIASGSQLPAVVAVCNGDLKMMQSYHGDMKGEALRKFIGELYLV